jgi:hypothetical protein
MRGNNNRLPRFQHVRFTVNDNFGFAINHLDKRIKREKFFQLVLPQSQMKPR